MTLICDENGKTDSFVPSVDVTDFSGVNPYTADGRYSPQNLQDLVAIVVDAERQQKKLKAVGSLYSLSKAHWSDNYIVNTSALNKHLSQPMSGNIPLNASRIRSPEHNRDWLIYIAEAEIRANNAFLVHVETGIQVKQLLADLAVAVAPGLALPTMGYGGGQTLAGSLSTATHGADVNTQPLIDAVRAIHLVGPGGQEWWIERTNGFSDPTKLKDLPGWCPETKVVQDDFFFYSVLVSVGRMGVIYSMILELTPEYWLEEHRSKRSWSEMREQLKNSIQAGYYGNGGLFNNRLNNHDLRFFQIVLNPNKVENCWIMERWLTDSRTSIETDKGYFDPIVTFCKPAHFSPAVILLIGAAGIALSAAGLFIPAGILAGIVVGTSDSLGELLSKLLSVSPDWVIKDFNDWTLDSAHEIPVRRNVSHKILDQQIYERDGCFQGNSAEYFFNGHSERFLEFVDEIFQHAKDVGPVPGYISLRFSRQSDAFLAMERFPLTVAIEISALRPWKANAEYFRKVEESALAKGGIPHWGQEHQIERDKVEEIYGEALKIFRWVLAEIEESGKSGTFSSDFTRSRGLEPILSLAENRKQVKERPVSLSQLAELAQQDLTLSTRPTSMVELASLFSPSMRDNTSGEVPTWGRAQQIEGRFKVSLRLLRLRFR
jgi:hypothetical protein